MNNTMKNLKDEIEGILKKHLYCVMRGSYFADNSANKTTYKGVTASAFMTSEGIEALTSLIEQEKERAIRKRSIKIPASMYVDDKAKEI